MLFRSWIPMFEFLTTIFAISALVLAHIKRVRLGYLIFAWPAVIIPTLTGTFSSMPRYVLLAFPMFIVMGLTKNRFIKYALLFVSIGLLIIFTTLFTRGHWVS